MKNYIENKIFNNHLLYREYDPSQTSALLYTNDTEITGYSINSLFSVSVPSVFPYIAVKFDWCSTDAYYKIWAYNRDVCGITVRGHYNYQKNLQKVCKPFNNSSAMNEATIYTADASTDIAANNTNESTYTTINYAWHNNTTGFSAAVAGIWRYRDARSNNISTLSNITCTNEQGGPLRRMFYCKNVKIACFNNAEDCLKTSW